MGGMGAVYALGWPVTAVVRWRVSKASPSFAMIFLKRDVYAAPWWRWGVGVVGT